jgi:hypothetical protein
MSKSRARAVGSAPWILLAAVSLVASTAAHAGVPVKLPVPAEPSGSPAQVAKPKPHGTKVKRRPADPCRTRVPPRRCLAWVDYAVVITYRATDHSRTTVSVDDRRRFAERTTEIEWTVRSTEPVRVHRPLPGGELLLSFRARGKVTTSILDEVWRYCPPPSGSTAHPVTAIHFNGTFDGGINLFLGRTAGRSHATVGGAARGAVGEVRRSEFCQSDGTVSPPSTTTITSADTVFPGWRLADRGEPAQGNRSTSTQFGDRTIESGPVRGRALWVNGNLSGDVGWTQTWQLTCVKTAKGSC